MKFRRFVMVWIIMMVNLALLAGCVSDQSRRTDYLAANPSTSPEIAAAIKAGQIKVGMTKDQVQASWGAPCSRCYGTRQASWGDTWEYNTFGSGSYGAGSGTYIYFDRAGKVRSWSN